MSQRGSQVRDDFFTLCGEVCRDRGEDITPVEGFADRTHEIFLVLKVNDGFWGCVVQKTEKAVVRADKVVSLGFHEHGLSLGSHAGVDDTDKERSFGEIGIAYGQEIAGLEDVLGPDLVGEVDEMAVRCNT